MKKSRRTRKAERNLIKKYIKNLNSISSIFFRKYRFNFKARIEYGDVITLSFREYIVYSIMFHRIQLNNNIVFEKNKFTTNHKNEIMREINLSLTKLRFIKRCCELIRKH